MRTPPHGEYASTAGSPSYTRMPLTHTRTCVAANTQQVYVTRLRHIPQGGQEVQQGMQQKTKCAEVVDAALRQASITRTGKTTVDTARRIDLNDTVRYSALQAERSVGASESRHRVVPPHPTHCLGLTPEHGRAHHDVILGRLDASQR